MRRCAALISPGKLMASSELALAPVDAPLPAPRPATEPKPTPLRMTPPLPSGRPPKVMECGELEEEEEAAGNDILRWRYNLFLEVKDETGNLPTANYI